MKKLLESLPGLILRLLVLTLGVGAAACFFVFLPEGPFRLGMAAGAILAGLVLFGLVHLLLSRGAREGPAKTAVPLVLIGLLLLFPASMFWPGEIMYARFGVTVYGAIPVPALDIVVRPNGVLWFREKTHLITKAEVEALIGDGSGVDAIVIGIGWEEATRVEPEVHMVPCRTIHIVRTSEAFQLFNELKGEGKRVLLIAHTTC